MNPPTTSSSVSAGIGAVMQELETVSREEYYLPTTSTSIGATMVTGRWRGAFGLGLILLS